MNSLDQASAANIRLQLVSLVMNNGRKGDGTGMTSADVVKECEVIAKFIFSEEPK